jgi:hypothetical protein
MMMLWMTHHAKVRDHPRTERGAFAARPPTPHVKACPSDARLARMMSYHHINHDRNLGRSKTQRHRDHQTMRGE